MKQESDTDFIGLANLSLNLREQGVGFAISDRIQHMVTSEPTGISPRIMAVRLKTGDDQFITMLSIYAPTMCHPDEAKDEFYDQLSMAVRRVPQKDKLFLLGDFNARVGRDHVLWPNVLGKYGIGSANENGDRLLNFCASNGFIVMNTLFRLEEKDMATWTHPRSGHMHLIDYVIVRQQDRRDIRITRVMRGAECGTDHKLLEDEADYLFTESMF